MTGKDVELGPPVAEIQFQNVGEIFETQKAPRVVVGEKRVARAGRAVAEEDEHVLFGRMIPQRPREETRKSFARHRLGRELYAGRIRVAEVRGDDRVVSPLLGRDEVVVQPPVEARMNLVAVILYLQVAGSPR